MNNNFKTIERHEDLKSIIQSLSKHKEIISAYLYGSILSDKFNDKKSDIDILLIVNDTNFPNNFIDKISKDINNSHISIKLDVNIVFISEFINRWHIYRPPSYFIGIKYRNKLLWGKDLLKEVHDKEVTPELIYKRIVDLAQSSRGIYLNNKEPEFWVKKYIGWLKITVLEILFLSGEFDLSFSSGLEKLKKEYDDIDFLDCLKIDSTTIKELNHVAESLRLLVYNNFIK